MSKGISPEVVDQVLARRATGEAAALLRRYPCRHLDEEPRTTRFLINRSYLQKALAAWECCLEQTWP